MPNRLSGGRTYRRSRPEQADYDDLRRLLGGSGTSLLGGKLIEDVALTPYVDNTITHRLGRELKGWMAVKPGGVPFEFAASASAGQAVPNLTATKLNFDTEVYDLGNNFDPSTYQATVPVTGTYRFHGMHKWAAPLGGLSAQIAVYLNNTTVLSTNIISQNDAATDPVQESHWEGKLTAGDVVGLWCSHNVGAPHNILAFTRAYFKGSILDRLYDVQSTNLTPDKTLVLRTTYTRTVSLWVF